MAIPLVKDKSLFASLRKKNSSGGYDYILKNILPNGASVKLGHVFNHLPNGIIDKTETAIGGTSLELDSDRSSIIVQPYVLTAYSKSIKPSMTRNYEILFYGKNPFGRGSKHQVSNGDTQNIIASFFDADADKKLIEYIKKCKKAKTHIKITCVTDQLEGLKSALDNYDKKLFPKLHIVLDEIDCLQEHSTFRKVMETCIDIYKTHPPNNRTLISATIKKFNDKILKGEPFTKISYANPNKQVLYIVSQPHELKEETIEQVKHIVKNLPGKIVIACNHIEYCYWMAEAITANPSVSGKTVKILCSTSSYEKAKDYFDILSPDGNLPADINFITSAYFNGLDINEKYHSLILADGAKDSLRISPSLIYQITGRCREGLYSNTLIIKVRQKQNYITGSLEKLEEEAKELCSVLNALPKLKKSNNPNIVNATIEIDKLLTSGNKKFYSVLKTNNKGEYETSYLKIDARLEQEDTYKKYSLYKDFITSIKERFTTIDTPVLSTKDTQNIKKITPLVEGKSLITQIKQLSQGTNYESQFKNEILYNKSLSKLYKIFYIADQLNTLDPAKLESNILGCLKVKTFPSRLDNLILYLEFHLNIINKTSSLSRLFSNNFVIGKNIHRKNY